MVEQRKLLLGLVLGLAMVWLFYSMCKRTGRCLVLPGSRSASVSGMLHRLQRPQRPSGECYRFDVGDNVCQFPEDPARPTEYVPAAHYQDPGYGSGQGSIGAVMEGFTSECLGYDPLGTEYPSTDMMPYQVACRKEPLWNLPRDARLARQAMYPCGVPGQAGPAECQRRHPMDSVYAPPNEGVMTRQVRN